MKACITILSLLVFSCSGDKRDNESHNQTTLVAGDTVIGSHAAMNDLHGGNYRKRATQYYLVVAKDTSVFRFFAEESLSGRVSFIVRFNPGATYRAQWKELRKIVPYVFKDFDIEEERLQLIFVSRLVTMGDLAIDVTRAYEKLYGVNDRALTFGKVNSLLMQTKLTTDWNEILKPYAVEVDTVFTEKIFFAQKQELFRGHVLEADSSVAPQEILDGMVWIRLKQKKVYSEL